MKMEQALLRFEQYLRRRFPQSSTRKHYLNDLSPQPTARSRTPSPTQLQKLRRRLASWPTWLGEALDAFLCWHWPTWRAQTAYEYGQILLSAFSRFGQWVTAHRSVQDWEACAEQT